MTMRTATTSSREISSPHEAGEHTARSENTEEPAASSLMRDPILGFRIGASESAAPPGSPKGLTSPLSRVSQDGARGKPIPPPVRANGGSQLSAALLARMNAALGHDFSHVRVHTDAEADQAAEQVRARAFTIGSHIWFKQGLYSPGSKTGDELLMHELVHVKQHDEGRLPSAKNGRASKPTDGHEREAAKLAHDLAVGRPSIEASLSGSGERKARGTAQSRAVASRDATDGVTGSSTAIEPPASGAKKPGAIDQDDGANLRRRPYKPGDAPLAWVAPCTRVYVSGQHPEAPDWWYVTAYVGGTMLRGYTQSFRVNTDLPEPGATLYTVQPGDTVEKLAAQEFTDFVEDGHDLRYYENVLLEVNRQHGRKGISGTQQAPDIFGGGANNIQLEAGRRIWLVSPQYALLLKGQVADGSATNGLYAKGKRAAGHLEDVLKSVQDSPSHLGEVAAEARDLILKHSNEIIGVTCAFVAAELASVLLAATPTGVGQAVAAIIQLVLALLAAGAAAQAAAAALTWGKLWLELAWGANGDPTILAKASKAFIKMLAQLALAALAVLGVRGSVNKAMQTGSSAWEAGLITSNPGMVLSNGTVLPGSIGLAPATPIAMTARPYGLLPVAMANIKPDLGGGQQSLKTYRSIREAPGYPKGFKDASGGFKKVPIKNLSLLDELRRIEAGDWSKVYRDGYTPLGEKVSIHYFQSKSGLVFDVKVKPYWSNL